MKWPFKSSTKPASTKIKYAVFVFVFDSLYLYLNDFRMPYLYFVFVFEWILRRICICIWKKSIWPQVCCSVCVFWLFHLDLNKWCIKIIISLLWLIEKQFQHMHVIKHQLKWNKTWLTWVKIVIAGQNSV